MTKEQEAIERLNRFKTIEVLYSNTFAMHIEQLKTVQEDIETVLNMLNKKDKQIDLMTEWIEKHTKYYDEDGCYCELEKKICEKDIECKDCIKQKFEGEK